MPEYTFGLSEYTTWPRSFEDDVKLCVDLGIPYLEVTEFKLDHTNFPKQLRSIAESGLRVSSVQMTIHSLFKDSLVQEPADQSRRLEHMRASIERLSPHLPEGTPFVVITGAAPNGNVARTRESRFGMRLAFEPLNPVLMNTDTAIWSLTDAEQLVADVGHDKFGLCVDFGISGRRRTSSGSSNARASAFSSCKRAITLRREPMPTVAISAKVKSR